MNSYPPELLVQLAPVMFVAGLEGPSNPPAASPTTPGGAAAKDPFAVLSARLRDALMGQRKVGVWQPERGKVFQVVLVDKEIRFPPRTLPPSPHSPISPLTPSSPLHPDGLIAPIWIRKHTNMVPSVFVLFLRLFEFAPNQSQGLQGGTRSPLEQHSGGGHEQEREAEERKRDGEVAVEIGARKRVCAERGVKLTVVLLASRRMLDDPALDTRLTYIRRQGGLDARASLFVLSPVSQAELGDFVRSLQSALWDPSIEYYTAHSKRVRRKRNRHAQSSSTTPKSPGAHPQRPLRPEGWTVRYEYKMACFAEFRGEGEVALKHYQDAYDTLMIMFGSTAILPPRTKRWAEAKVLADCINVKVCKLYLYNNEHALGLSAHNTHVRRFSDFSRGWGIGEETYEFWSWVARQHRVLAELLEQGLHSTLKLPSLRPSSSSATSPTPALTPNAMEIDSMRVLGLNPNHALQHPGFCYYMAARCTERRRERFLSVEGGEGSSQAPGYVNEKKVDHLTIILELYTKSYELFKKYTPPDVQNQGRLTLYIAYRIAQTYYESGKFDMAVRFFERIAKTYRREKWGSMMAPLLSTWYKCAQKLGEAELIVRLLIEAIGYGVTLEKESPEEIQEDLMAVLKSTTPSTIDGPLVFDLPESMPILKPSVIFWSSEIKIGEPAAFQISLTAPSEIPITLLPFSSLSVHFTAEAPPVVVEHASQDDDSSTTPALRYVDVGNISVGGDRGDQGGSEPKRVSADLRWRAGGTIMLAGSVVSDVATSIKVTKIVLTLKEGSWWIELPIDPASTELTTPPMPLWLSSIEPIRYLPLRRSDCSVVTVQHRPHELHMNVSHQEPSYLDEEYPVVISITNDDDREFDIVLGALLAPGDADIADDHIKIRDDDYEATAALNDISLGSIGPGVSIAKTLHIVCSGGIGTRTLDLSIKSRPVGGVVSPASPTSPLSVDLDENKLEHVLLIPTASPIAVEHNTVYKRKRASTSALADLRTFDEDYWDDDESGEAVIMTKLQCDGPWGLEILNIAVAKQEGEYTRLLGTSLDDDDEEFPVEWLPGDEFCVVSRTSLALAPQQQEPIPGPAVYEVNWRRVSLNGERGTVSTTRFALPPLSSPTNGLVALMFAPPVAKLHVPFLLRLTVRNHHPLRSANVLLHLELDSSDGFVIAGMRSGRLPILLPGGEEQITWQLVALECGFVKIPKIKVIDKRKAAISSQSQPLSGVDSEVEEEIAHVVDVRWDGRSGPEGREMGPHGNPGADSSDREDSDLPPTILVLP